MGEGDSKLKEVRRVWGLSEADIVKSFLESNGIDSVFQGRNVLSVYALTTDGMGEVRIMVKEEDFEAAKALLDESDTTGAGES